MSSSFNPNINPLFAGTAIVAQKKCNGDPFTQLNPVDGVQEIYTVNANDPNEIDGIIVERIVFQFLTAAGNQNSKMLLVICLFDPVTSEWNAYDVIKVTTQHTVNYSSVVEPIRIEYIIDGGLLLKKDWKIGFAQSIYAGSDNDVIVATMEGGGLTNVIPEP